MSEVRFQTVGRAGLITLNRPEALNALSEAMVRAITEALAEWARDDKVERVVIGAEGKAFCAGGDLRDVHRRRTDALDFFRQEYRLNAMIEAFPKPHVALLKGVTMGGGIGLSVHGSHRVAAEGLVMAMPEVSIGLFPDVGVSHVLARLPDGAGLHLALTGARLDRDGAAALGLVTHPTEGGRLDDALDRTAHARNLDAALGELVVETEPRDDAEAAVIAAAFAPQEDGDDVEAIMGRLQDAARDSETADVAVKAMAAASPTSLKVTARQVAAARDASFEEVMRTDFRILSQVLEGHDFYEGIRAVVIDKDGAPRWSPARLDDVSEELVESHFAAPPHGDLELS